MAVAEGRAARAGLAKLAAANRADELLALLAVEQPVLPELDFTRALRRAGASLDDDERRAVLRKFPARDESGLRGVQVSLLLEHLRSARPPARTPPGAARRSSTPEGSGSRRRPSAGAGGGVAVEPPVNRQLTLKPAVVRQRPRQPQAPEPLPELQRLPPAPLPERQPEPEPEPEPPPQPLLQWEPEPEPELEPEWKFPAQLASVVAEPAHVTILEPSAAPAPTEGAAQPELPSSRSGDTWRLLAAALAAALAATAYRVTGRGGAVGVDPRLLSDCGEDLRCWLSVAGADRLETASGLSALGISTVSNLLGARLSTADLAQLGVPSVAYLEAQYAHILRDQPLPPQPPLPPPPPTPVQEGSSWSLLLEVAVLWYGFVCWMQPSNKMDSTEDSGDVAAKVGEPAPSTPADEAPVAPTATLGSRGSHPRRSLNTPNTPTHTWAGSTVGSAGSRLGSAGQQSHAPRTPGSPTNVAQRRRVVSPPMPIHAASPTMRKFTSTPHNNLIPRDVSDRLVLFLVLTMVDGGMTAVEHRKLVANVAAAQQESHDTPEPVVVAANGAAALDGAMASLR